MAAVLDVAILFLAEVAMRSAIHQGQEREQGPKRMKVYRVTGPIMIKRTETAYETEGDRRRQPVTARRPYL
jgi:hypothetical protein